MDHPSSLVDETDIVTMAGVCEIFLYMPIWYLNDGGIGSVSTNQAAAMTTNGAPNDLLGNFNPLTIIVTVPFMGYVLYPGLAVSLLPILALDDQTRVIPHTR